MDVFYKLLRVKLKMDKLERKIEIKNIGPLKKFSIDIKDVTIILGLPNSGKSYALKSAYLFLEMLDKYKFDLVRKNFLGDTRIQENEKESDAKLYAIEDEIMNEITNIVNAYKSKESKNNTYNKSTKDKVIEWTTAYTISSLKISSGS